MNTYLPVLYSFRRCPYAMRARLALAAAAVPVELREVVLRNKPQQLLDISPKGTVPVLLLSDGKVIEESLDIMYWALSHQDPNNWLNKKVSRDNAHLIQTNDGRFKYYLDRYKYADRYSQHDQLYYRLKAEAFLILLETRLSKHTFLCDNHCNFADIAIFPFIRQFAHVNFDWFQSSEYKKLNQWLSGLMESPLFIAIMEKYPAWQANAEKTLLFSFPQESKRLT